MQSTNWYFLAFFFLSGLQIFQIWSYFRHFENCGQFLNITGYLALSYVVKFISTGSHFFSHFLLLNKLYELNFLNYKTYFRQVQLLKHYLYLRPFDMFSSRQRKFKMFFLVWKLCRLGLFITTMFYLRVFSIDIHRNH